MERLPEPPLIELLRRAQTGDGAARDQLFERVYERVLAIVRGRLGAGLRRFHESQDVVQEALLQAVRSLGQAQLADEAALLSWLASVVENRLRDLAKFHGAQRREAERERRETSIDPDGVGLWEARAGAAPGAGPASLAAESEQQERLRAALQQLEPKRAQAIEYRSQGLSWAEVAERLGLPSEGAARMLHARALVDLGRALEGPTPSP
jgi:RNA polymerase sigma-70 factor, ECF subfamily